MTTMTIAKAINEGLRARPGQQPAHPADGRGHRPAGRRLPRHRRLDRRGSAPTASWDTPLAESGIIGTAIGLALSGYLPVCEIQFDGFVFPGFNQITTQLARCIRAATATSPSTVVIRIPYGGGIGSIEPLRVPEALFAHTAGLRIITRPTRTTPTG